MWSLMCQLSSFRKEPGLISVLETGYLAQVSLCIPPLHPGHEFSELNNEGTSINFTGKCLYYLYHYMEFEFWHILKNIASILDKNYYF
jgi:hypothetical protein